VRPNYCFIQR